MFRLMSDVSLSPFPESLSRFGIRIPSARSRFAFRAPRGAGAGRVALAGGGAARRAGSGQRFTLRW